MVERILFFNNTASRYDVLPYFTAGLKRGMIRAGVESETISADKSSLLPLLKKMYIDPPDCTLCFNGLLPNEDESFFADMVEIPHVACLVDSVNWFFNLLKSPYYIITCPDKYSCKMLEDLNFKNGIFMPHGVDSTISLPPETDERPFEVVFFGTCIDFQKIQEDWRIKRPKKMVEAIEAAADATLSSPSLPYQEALLIALENSSQEVTALELPTLFQDLDQYIRGKDRAELILSIRDVPVHVFGSSLGSLSWKKQLKNAKNVIFHDPLPYQEALEMMKKSKIVLNSSPMFKQGGHERIFTALACGALSLTNQTSYMFENFQDQTNIALYSPKDKTDINDQVLYYLSHEETRRQIALKGRKVVMEHHTWDHRAQALIRDLDPILERLN